MPALGGPDGWWRRIVWRAEFRPDDVVVIGRPADTRVRDLQAGGAGAVALAFWLLAGLPFGLGCLASPVVWLGVWPPPGIQPPTGPAYLWRVPLGLFTVAMDVLSLRQWITVVAFLRYRAC